MRRRRASSTPFIHDSAIRGLGPPLGSSVSNAACIRGGVIPSSAALVSRRPLFKHMLSSMYRRAAAAHLPPHARTIRKFHYRGNNNLTKRKEAVQYKNKRLHDVRLGASMREQSFDLVCIVQQSAMTRRQTKPRETLSRAWHLLR